MYLQHRTITGLLLSQVGANDVHKYDPGAENAASSSFKNDMIVEDVDVPSLEEAYNLTEAKVRKPLSRGLSCTASAIHANTSSCTP